MERSIVLLVARKELRDALRNRWFLLYTVGFGILALTLARLALSGETVGGYVGFGRTTASLINLVLLVVPLMALTLGAASLAQERENGTLVTLLAQPVTRAEVLLGKYLGLALALNCALALGFGSAAALASAGAGTVDAGTYGILVGYAALLSLAMLSIGFLISALSSRAGAANGTALFTWLGFVFLGDLGLLGTALTMQMSVGTLFGLTVVNPLESYKIAAVSTLTGSLDVLGPAGVYAVRTFGDGLTPLLLGVLVLWAALPLCGAGVAFQRRPLR
jgi:Cu-processing system permease protein